MKLKHKDQFKALTLGCTPEATAVQSLRNPSSARPACDLTWDFHGLDIFIAEERCCVSSLQGTPAYRAALSSPPGDAARIALGFFPSF